MVKYPAQERAFVLPPRPDTGRHAFFLDVDGTLVDFASHPESVSAGPVVLSLLRRLERAAGGALALVSGRTIDSLDRVTAPHRFTAAGIHGLEWRSARGQHAAASHMQSLERARAALRGLALEHPRLLVEDKGSSIALHFRAAPELAVLASARAEAAVLAAPQLRVQHGHMVVEVLPRIASKHHALAAFMNEAPFRGRIPLFVGDDLTDEPAFEWVNAAGGLSIAVAASRRPTAAQVTLPSVAAVRTWLESAVELVP